MPVHAHHTAECLKPKWVTETSKQLRHTIRQQDAFGDSGPKFRHAAGKPGRHASAVQRKISRAGPFHACLISGISNNSFALPSPGIKRAIEVATVPFAVRGKRENSRRSTPARELWN